MTELTEFTEIDPDSVHLVGTSANGFPAPLLAKAALDEARSDALVKSFVDGLCGIGASCSVCHSRYQVVKELDGGIEKARMKAKERHALSDSQFAFPDQRKEPLNDEEHVRNAISRFSSVEGVSAEERKQAAHRIIARAKELGIDVSEDSDVARAAKQLAPDREVPLAEAKTQTEEAGDPEGPAGTPEAEDGGEPRSVAFPHPPAWNGQGDTSPDKAIPTAEALSQTHANAEGITKAEGDGTGTHLADGEVSTQASEVQTEKAGSADSEPGSEAWEHKDVALGEKAERLVAELAEVVRTFTEREKAEGGASKQARRILAGVQYVADKPALLKELAEMPTTELVKALDELGAARRGEDAAFKAAVKAEAEKLAKKMKKKDKRAKAKGAEGEAVEDAETSKAAEPTAEELAKQLAEVRETVAKMAAQDGKRIPLNEAGVAAVLRDPAARDSAFKVFEARVSAAESDLAKATAENEPYAISVAKDELRQARHQLVAMKMIATENARERDPSMVARAMRGQGVPLLSNRHQLPDDTGLKAL